MTADNYRFNDGDSLLCYHGPMLYEAKCLKRRKSDDGKAQYFVHYKGWNSKWEEWVDDDRVLAVNAVNMNKMASLKEIHSNSKKGGAKRSITVIKEEAVRNTTPVKGKKRKHSEISLESTQVSSVLSPSEPKPKKRGRPPKSLSSSKVDSIEETDASEPSDKTVKIKEEIKITKSKEQFEGNKSVKETEINEERKKRTESSSTGDAIFIVPAPVVKAVPVINIPIVLKKRLAYDFIMITQKKNMLTFPKKYTTEKVIRAFLCENCKLKFKYRERSVNIGLTLIQYFNVIIHTKLLYREEVAYGIRKKARNRLHKKAFNGSIKELHFKKLLYPKKMWHYIYGPTYLIRLFEEFPRLLSMSMFNDKQIAFIVKNIEYFLKFVEKNYSKFFSTNDYQAIDEQ